MIKKVFLFILIALLWLPLIQMATGFQSSLPVDENRSLAPRPNFSNMRLDKFASGAVNWFNDNYGLRDFFIRAKTQVDFSTFGMSTRVHIGKEGWLFYRNVIDIQQPRVENFLDKNSNRVLAGIKSIAKTLKERKIKLIVMIGPMKNVFYGDKLVDKRNGLPDARQINLMRTHLKSIEDIIFIDSYDILSKAAETRPVFHKTDFHWNDPAAYDVSVDLVNKLGALEGDRGSLWKGKLEIELVKNSGGEAMFMPLFFPPKEMSLLVKRNWSEPANIYKEKMAPYDWIYELISPPNTALRPIVVLGDSFFDGMLRSGFPIYFKKTYRANWNRASLKEILKDIPNDAGYLFLEFIEVSESALNQIADEK